MIELSSRKEVLRVQHDSSINTIAFSLDGRHFASGSKDGTVQILPYHPEDMIAYSCQKVQRNLSLDEWQRFVGKETPYHITCPGKYIPRDAQAELDRIQGRNNKIIIGSIGGAVLSGIVFVVIQRNKKRR